MTKNRQRMALAVVNSKDTSVGCSTAITAGKAAKLAVKAKVMELLMTSGSVAEAARQSGISRKTIYD